MAYGNYMGSSDVLNYLSHKYDRGQQMRVRDLLNQLALTKLRVRDIFEPTFRTLI